MTTSAQTRKWIIERPGRLKPVKNEWERMVTEFRVQKHANNARSKNNTHQSHKMTISFLLN